MLNRKGKLQTKGLVIIIIVLVMVLTSTFIIAWWYTKNKPEDSTIMLIEKDEDFTQKYNLPGSGTEEDPYRIENDHIYQVYKQIYIKDTTKFFVIQSVVMETQFEDIIRITDVANGTVLIRDNSFLDLKYSMSSYIILINNTSGARIIRNTFYSEYEYSSVCGIRVLQSNSVHIEENYMMFLEIPIYLSKSNNSKIINNECGFTRLWWQQGSIYITLSHNVEINNNTIFYDYTGIGCSGSKDISIFNNSILFCTNGIKLSGVFNCNITKNLIHKSDEIGIDAGGIDSCILNNNTINNTNGTGIFLSLCDYNNVTYNTLANSTNYALRLYLCDNNTIWNNNFIENNVNGTITVGVVKYYSQGYDNNNNFWHLESSSIGNYWSDLIWNSTATYSLDWGLNVDLHPLEFPV